MNRSAILLSGITLLNQVNTPVGFRVPTLPGAYLSDPAVVQPVVGLCNTQSVVIQPNNMMDLCLTLNPDSEEGMPKSFLCNSLPFGTTGADKYTIHEADDQCMLKMRSHANGLGIHLSSPILFTYSLESGQPGEADLKGSVSVHFKWSQQSKPFNPLKANNDKSSAQASPPIFIVSILALLHFS